MIKIFSADDRENMFEESKQDQEKEPYESNIQGEHDLSKANLNEDKAG